MRIDCTQCEMYRTSHCDDCLVTALLHPPSEEVEIADDLSDSLRTLAGAGLVPLLRFRPRSAAPPGDRKSEAGGAAEAG